MRRWYVVLALLATPLLAGCGRQTPLAPAVGDEAAPGSSAPFVLVSALDSRLPAPLHEADGAPAAEIAALAGAGSGWREEALSSDNPAVFWSERCTQYGLAGRLPPPLMARAYALTHIAIYDALIACGHPRRRGLPDRAAAAGAASQVLVYLFPADSAAIISAALAEAGLDGRQSMPARRAWFLGRAVGQLFVLHGQQDRSNTPWDATMPTGDGIWTGTNPVLPMCGTWKTWIITSGAEFQPEPPYAYGSPGDLADVESVYQASLQRTAEQIAIVYKWANLPPPTIWCDLLNQRLRRGQVDTFASARAHAFLNATMYDAFVSCWRSKYQYWTARPFQRITGLVTVVPTPNFPTYTSGHSTISGAAAQIMAALFPAESAFFQAQAEEAALSRFWGGIHFHHDDDAGLAVGRQIGDKAVRAMRGRDGGGAVAAR
jgi:hypothetical protein